jgi:hypothetical protein
MSFHSANDYFVLKVIYTMVSNGYEKESEKLKVVEFPESDAVG